METIWQAAIHTPWWVYVLLVYLIIMGFKASRTRVIELKRLFIIPALFTFLSVQTLLSSFKVDTFSILTWVIAILIGVAFGYLQIIRHKLRVDKKSFLVEMPGTWSTLVLIIIIFTSKYYFGYELSVDPQIAQQTLFEFSMLGISGVCTGLFIGRLFCYLYRFVTSESVELSMSSSSLQ